MNSVGLGMILSAEAIAVYGLLMGAFGRIKPYQVSGIFGLGNCLIVVGGVLAGWATPWLSINAGIGALNLYQWWNGGGGDDTKRRLRKLARAFTPVRRTAPVGA